MNKMVERSVRDTKDMLPVASPVQQDDQSQSVFLDPDVSDFQSGPRLRGAILEHSGRVISGWIVDAQSPASTVAISLFVASHCVEEGRTGRSVPASVGPHTVIGRPGFRINLSTPSVRRRLARALKNTLLERKPVQIYLRISLNDGEHYEIPLFEKLESNEVVVALGFSTDDYDDLLFPNNDKKLVAAMAGAASVKEVRYVCFYLPQFHSFAENDRWWGPGFTEWTNVSQMRPQFPTHQSPWLPADLGFYDMRLVETRQQQADLARRYGVHGFCYYAYWFQGRRLLERPLRLLLEDGEPNIPFCICWANENWSRRWDGSDTELLLGQNHSLEDDVRFIDDMADILLDDRYITVDGRKILLIYRPSLIPDKERLFQTWRVRARQLGIGELLICNAMTFGEFDPREFHCDAAVEFPPHTVNARELSRAEVETPTEFSGKLYDYLEAMRSTLGKVYEFPFFPTVMPRWDNTPRKGSRGHVFVRSSPEAFEVWLREATERARRSSFEQPIVFINSWNEWAEGAHLEPDSRFGRAYLDVVRRVSAGESISAELRSNSALLDCLSRSELEQTIKSAAVHVEVLANLQRNEVALTGFQSIREGLPVEIEGAIASPDGSMFVIENINSQTEERVVVDPRYRVLVRGWVFAKDGFEPLRNRISFLVLSPEGETNAGKSGYCLVIDWHERMDVTEYMKATARECCFGFEVSFMLKGLPDGEYRLSMLEVGEGENLLVGSSHSLVVRH